VLGALNITTAEEFAVKVTKCCNFRDYMVNGFNNVFNGTEGYQLLTAVDSTSNEVLAFLTAQRGECELKPDVWSVNLICAATVRTLPNGIPTFPGTLIMGAMLYSLSILGRPFAVLELASGYTNIQGFLAYSKLGFIKNLSLFNHGMYDKQKRKYNPQCFYDPANLPMYVSLNHFTPEIIKDIVTGRKKIKLNSVQDDTGLYEAYSHGHRYTDKDQQMLAAENVLYQTYLCINPDHRQLITLCRMNPVAKQRLYDESENLPKGLIPDQVEMPEQIYDIVTIRHGGQRKRTRRTKKRGTRKINRR